jgi:hypothetical protein
VRTSANHQCQHFKMKQIKVPISFLFFLFFILVCLLRFFYFFCGWFDLVFMFIFRFMNRFSHSFTFIDRCIIFWFKIILKANFFIFRRNTFIWIGLSRFFLLIVTFYNEKIIIKFYHFHKITSIFRHCCCEMRYL